MIQFFKIDFLILWTLVIADFVYLMSLQDVANFYCLKQNIFLFNAPAKKPWNAGIYFAKSLVKPHSSQKARAHQEINQKNRIEKKFLNIFGIVI